MMKTGGATAEKYRYIRDQQMERRERGLMFLDDGNLPVLPTWEEQIQQLPRCLKARPVRVKGPWSSLRRPTSLGPVKPF
ncbi:MAG: hypothetical protein CM15mP74_02040 [Halieaceae bacterium]|nr:MAG: hypothetical protein CM15mP74_02040 [Halieaceae bacterium]